MFGVEGAGGAWVEGGGLVETMLAPRRRAADALLLAARRPEVRQRYLQPAKAAAERALDVAECIPYGLGVSWLHS